MKYNKQNQKILDISDIFKKSEISNNNATIKNDRNYILSVHNEVI
jgi:hypothetical protein